MNTETREAEPLERPWTFRCKECKGDTFSVADLLEDHSPILCDQCGAVVGHWADVRALTNIPAKDVLESSGADIFSESYSGVAEISLVEVEP